MEMQGYKIIPPTGMECYLDGSEIKFRRKVSCYEDVAKELFKDKIGYFLTSDGVVRKSYLIKEEDYCAANVCTSAEQADKILATNRLLNVAKFLNQDWVPDWSSSTEFKYFLHTVSNEVQISCINTYNVALVYFKTKELAKKAIEILGENTIKLALTTDF